MATKSETTDNAAKSPAKGSVALVGAKSRTVGVGEVVDVVLTANERPEVSAGSGPGRLLTEPTETAGEWRALWAAPAAGEHVITATGPGGDAVTVTVTAK